MRRRLFSILIAALGVVSCLFVQGEAQAGIDDFFVFTTDLNDVDVPRFAFEVEGGVCLDDTVVTVPGVPEVVVDLLDANHGTFTLPGAPPGEYEVDVSCTADSGPEFGSGFIDFGYVLVDKVVTGDVPPTAQFVVEVLCDAGLIGSPEAGSDSYGGGGGNGAGTAAVEGIPPVGPDGIEATLTYGPAGGHDELVHYRGQSCTIEETETGGAQTVTVETEDCGEEDIDLAAEGTTVGSFEVFAAVSCTQTVTNDFAPADVEPDDVAPDVVQAAPSFTG